MAILLGMAIPASLAAQSNALQGFHNKVLDTFNGQQDGANPYAGLIADDAGNVYGTAVAGRRPLLQCAARLWSGFQD